MKIPCALGSLCPHGHDHGGGSLRYLVRGQPIGSCVDCGRAANNAHRASLRATREREAKEQNRNDGKYLGSLCGRDHDDGSGSLRYVYDGSCVKCDRQRNKSRRDSPGGKSYERARKHKENLQRALGEFSDPDLRQERAQTYDAESKLRTLRRKVRAHGSTQDRT